MKELQDYTVGDWLEAQKKMSNAAFAQLKKVAAAGRIKLPSVIAPTYQPRIMFDSLSEDDSDLYSRVQDLEALNKFNSEVKEWAKLVESELRQSAKSLFVSRTADQVSPMIPLLHNSIKTNLRFDKKHKLETRSVGFQIARHGVYLHQGAGRSYGGLKGSEWTDKYGTLKKTETSSIGRMGSGARPAVHWFNNVLVKRVPELADILAEYSLDLVLNIGGMFLPE